MSERREIVAARAGVMIPTLDPDRESYFSLLPIPSPISIPTKNGIVTPLVKAAGKKNLSVAN